MKKKKVLITGGAAGIGRAIASELAKEYSVHILDLNNGIKCDVLDDSQIEKVPNDFDILINNVGGGGTWGNEKQPEKFTEWDQVYQKNAGAAYKFTMKCLPYMKKKRWGRVITISSIYGKEKGIKPWFDMAKSAEIALMKNLAGRFPGITFNTICPGYIDVGKEMIIGHKVGKPKDVAYLVSFLCSNKARHINGACIVIDGGESHSY